MSNIVIIPARGGSKGIKRKNLRYVWGKPLVVSSAIRAKNAKNVDEIFVSSEDDEIKKICSYYEIKVIDRPKELALDETSTDAVIEHSLFILKKMGFKVTVLGLLQCTAPFVTTEDIEKVIDVVFQQKADSAFAACKWHGFIWKENNEGFAVGINHDGINRLRRQDMDLTYLEAGSIYAVNPIMFEQHKTRFCGNSKAIEVDSERIIDIDDENDLVFARLKAPFLANKILKITSLSTVKGIALDFDGVFTNNKIYVDENGIEQVRCSKSDGVAVSELKKLGIKLVIISQEKNPVVVKRAEKIGINIINGVNNKLTIFQNWLKENKLSKHEVIFVGNDTNDIECLCEAGISIVPADAEGIAKRNADVLLNKNGGDGVLREIYELIKLEYDFKNNI